ncbi:Fatty acid oxidation complex subunit alpha [Mycobacterium simulans]|uniref:DsrE family protein n=1 Tax=Mycobacterium simulans TaxID=627089 RepID=UPI00199CC409|nr:DsrE family protein [Mycobacterium simulans]SON59205.1 Fatty acid oxidation complex subunit alpha [Mycobacterium simulans]
MHIDIPIQLDEVKVAVSVASLSFEGDMPAVLFHAGLVITDAADWQAKSQVVVVFHTNAGHVTLDDEAYSANRHIATGNPDKPVVAALIQRGAQVELCGATAKANAWHNADLIPGIKINRNAMARLTQLVQQGYAKTSESYGCWATTKHYRLIRIVMDGGICRATIGPSADQPPRHGAAYRNRAPHSPSRGRRRSSRARRRLGRPGVLHRTRVHATVEMFRTLSKATIAVIEGICRGGGTQRLPRLVGRGRALDVILGCLDIDAATAEAWGYVERALPVDELRPFVDKLAARIASAPAGGHRSGQTRGRRRPDRGPHDRLAHRGPAGRETLAQPVARERLQAIIDAGAQTRAFELGDT